MAKATKDLIIEQVKEIREERTGQSVIKKELKLEIEDVFLAVEELLTDGYDVPLGNVGTLKNKVRAARKGRNPQTGEELDIAESKAIGFTQSKHMKETLNNK